MDDIALLELAYGGTNINYTISEIIIVLITLFLFVQCKADLTDVPYQRSEKKILISSWFTISRLYNSQFLFDH